MNHTEENLRRIRAYNRTLDSWKEDEHPRDEKGRFKKGAGESKTPGTPKEIKVGEVLGNLARIVGEAVFPPDTKHTINPRSKLGYKIRRYGKEHLEHINGLLERAPESFLRCWRIAGDELVLLDGAIDNPEESKYHKGSVRLNLEADAKGNHYLYPYETFFHEFGHNLDAALGYAGKGYSEIYKNGAFGKVLREESDKLLQPIREKLRKEDKTADDETIEERACKKLQLEFMDMIESGEYTLRDLSPVLDTMNGYTKAKFKLGAWHKDYYWNHDQHLENDAFADMCTSLTSSPDRVRIYKKWFPKSYAMYLEMIEEVGKWNWTNKKIVKGQKR